MTDYAACHELVISDVGSSRGRIKTTVRIKKIRLGLRSLVRKRRHTSGGGRSNTKWRFSLVNLDEVPGREREDVSTFTDP